jgi:predicted restriction endonuclease
MYRNRDESTIAIKLSGSRCVICGWRKTDSEGNLLVEGGHIKQCKDIGDLDKKDNIIALCPNHHVEFDRGNLTIDYDRRICVHIDPGDEFSNKELSGSIAHIGKGYLDYHRRNIFRGESL